MLWPAEHHLDEVWSEGREWTVLTVINALKPTHTGENAELCILQSALTLHQVQFLLRSCKTQRPTFFHRSPVPLHARNFQRVCSERTVGYQLSLRTVNNFVGHFQ